MDILSLHLGETFKSIIYDKQKNYPIIIPLKELTSDFKQYSGQHADEVVKGYINGFFDILSIIGASRSEEDSIIIENERQAATIICLCWALQEKIDPLFNFKASRSKEQQDYGAYFLNRLEQRRKDKDQNGRRRYSRIQEMVIILVKAKFRNKPYILFQYDQRRDGYKFIGGRKKPTESLDSTAKRELYEEVTVCHHPDSDKYAQISIDYSVNRLSDEPLEYDEISKMIGAYTHYIVHVYECSIKLPEKAQKKQFIGEERRKTRWIDEEKVKSDNKEILYADLIDKLQHPNNNFLHKARVSTDQKIRNLGLIEWFWGMPRSQKFMYLTGIASIIGALIAIYQLFMVSVVP